MDRHWLAPLVGGGTEEVAAVLLLLLRVRPTLLRVGGRREVRRLLDIGAGAPWAGTPPGLSLSEAVSVPHAAAPKMTAAVVKTLRRGPSSGGVVRWCCSWWFLSLGSCSRGVVRVTAASCDCQDGHPGGPWIRPDRMDVGCGAALPVSRWGLPLGGGGSDVSRGGSGRL